MSQRATNSDPPATTTAHGSAVAAAHPSALARFEEVRLREGSSIAVNTYDEPCFERGWHYHPEAEITLIVESSGQRFVGDHIAPFEPGDLVLIGPNLPHSWRNQQQPLPTGRRARSIYVQFDAGRFHGELAQAPEFDAIRGLLGKAARGLHFTGPARDAAARQLESLAGSHGLRRLTAFLDMLHGLAESHAGEPLSSEGFVPVVDEAASERIRKIHHLVFVRFAGEIPHHEIARLVGLNPSALSHFFRRTTGRTITEFIHEVRIGQAVRMLIDTPLNVSEIAYACGFGSLSNFNNVFRRLKGISPSDFRRLRHEAIRQ